EALDDVSIVVDDGGTIVAVDHATSPAALAAIDAATSVHRLAPDERLLPGLIDLHIHAPQWPQLGTGLDLPLERWLFEHTFPLEARFADPAFAAEVWAHMVPTLLAHGTTTAVYFSSIHEPATLLLAEECVRRGQRAFVGRVAMDHPEGTPDWYRDADAAAGIEASRRSIDAIRSIAGAAALVQPIVTPRFVPACTDELLTGLGRLAAETGTLIQTHCSESDWEHGAVLERCGITDTRVLAQHGLLRAGTVLAHGNHIGDDDFATIAEASAGVACCPLSNAYFANGVFPIARARRAGVRVGLGTDVAGGAEPGLLPQAAFAVTASRMLRDGVDVRRDSSERGTTDTAIDTVTAFHLATAGGADVLGAPLGRFAVGSQFDAIVVDTAGAVGSALRRWPEVDTEDRLFEKIVRLARPVDITSVWVAGSRVGLPG
ncbi:MAG: amidohydrolase family protein, partial [Ilumatobacteraceae bacterium]